MTLAVKFSEDVQQAQPCLDDKTIRQALIQKISGTRPRAIIEELHVHRGDAIADVVSIHSEAHCYEIKGATDNINRILEQGKYYDLVFPKVSLVTTENHLGRALRLAPVHWGILLAYPTKHGVKIKHIRASMRNKLFDKQLALLTLWRSELAEVAVPLTQQKTARMSRASLSELIAAKLSQESLMKNIGEKLAARTTAKLDSLDSYTLCAC